MTSQLTSDIESVRVTATNPPTSTSDTNQVQVDSPRLDPDEMNCSPSTSLKAGMDFERCAALHNAILRHGWTARGHDLLELSNRTWWDRWKLSLSPYQSETLQDRLHPSVLDFLKTAIELPDFYPGSFEPPNFFYHLVGLNAPLELFANHEEAEGDRYVTLYCLQGALANEGKMPDGLVYDQLQHKCVLIRDVDDRSAIDLDQRDLQWQSLETILTEYCKMIEVDKVVALPKSVKGPESFEYIRNPAGGYAMKDVSADDLRDPRTGARRTKKSFDPWVMVPFTGEDVSRTLQAWNNLVAVIQDRLPNRKGAQSQCWENLYPPKVLARAGLRRDGFAFSVLSQAIKPAFSNIAPGLRLLDEREFVRQPFQNATFNGLCSTPSILLLKGSKALNTLSGECLPEFGDEVPAGLYLERCDPDAAFPFENAVHVTLPFRSMSILNMTCAILESDMPHLLSSGVRLHTILERFAERVESGQWIIGTDGVEGDVFEGGE